MSINLTSDQEQFIQSKLKSGKYQTPEEVVSIVGCIRLQALGFNF